MRVVSLKKIKNFIEKHPNSKIPLLYWYNITKKANWQNLTDIKKDFRTVDYIGSSRYVFDIKGNDFRLVAIIIPI